MFTAADARAEKPLPFDVKRSHDLYNSLFGEVADLIKGKHLLIVPSGALTTLPFQVLVSAPPVSSDLAAARWLVLDHAITVMPSVSSLLALRSVARPSTSGKPFIAFANPLLEGDQNDPESGARHKQLAMAARQRSNCAAVGGRAEVAMRALSPSALPVVSGGGLADVKAVRRQIPLPETADEVCEVARSVGAQLDDVHIGARATETEIKRLSAAGELAKYRIIHIATHGVVAGELSGAQEPGLLLTPPPTATAADDGYLSAGEIASLKLDAEWIVLSACNTAAGLARRGERGEALSGLARAFIYAGARALLVSHWAVDSAATVKLTTTIFSTMTRDPRVGRAEALRRAMIQVMADRSRPANWIPSSHPSVWAPFVLVGDGAAQGR
jgi:CHAT domain-containing protein